MSVIIFLEGNIGAGKTTLLNNLKSRYESDKGLVMTEPVSNWPSLKSFYEDKRKYAYQLQTEVMQSFHDRETKCPLREYYIFERSLRTAMEVFAKLNCLDDEIDRLRAIGTRMGRPNLFPFTRTVYIYIRTPAQLCLRNIGKRGKVTDSYIDLDYLTMLEESHDRVFKTGASSDNVIVVDGDQTEAQLVNVVSAHIDEIIHKTVSSC